jgi:hypothetical protein
VDVGDGNGFQEAALLRGVEPLVQVTSNGELVDPARPVAVPVALSPADLDRQQRLPHHRRRRLGQRGG